MALSAENSWQKRIKERMRGGLATKPHKRKKKKSEEVIIEVPIKVIPSKNYYLVIKDATGRYHYFNEEGEYDGWSEDVK